MTLLFSERLFSIQVREQPTSNFPQIANQSLHYRVLAYRVVTCG